MNPTELKARELQIIRSPEEQRRFLLEAMVMVAEGKMNVSQANAIIGLSAEVHKSIRQQWDMHVYASSNVMIAQGKVIAIEHRNIDEEANDGDSAD